jgi:branched-chain amino acid transport system permease protein
VIAFAIGAAFAGFAGSLFTHDAAFISPGNFNMWGTIYILVWLVIGGPRKMWGPIVGAVIMTLIAEYLRMSGMLQTLFYAGVLLLAVMAMPQGIVGLVDSLRARVGRPRTTDEGGSHPADGIAEGSP